MNPLRVLTFVQFVIVCLGVLGLHLLVKAGDVPEGPACMARLSAFMARYGWWFLFCPIFNAIMVVALIGRIGRRPAAAVSIGLTIGVALLFGLPLLFHLR
ncbi:MAG: hypothetical protein IAE97_08145 [Chthoniobacterales bacterium]|nr:hypothetical protein [Chthoniobacterales bacterium]